MHLIRDSQTLTKIPLFSQGCVATIGTYDGVHLGHCKVLNRVLRRARELSLPSAVVFFEPQPEEHLSSDILAIPARLMKISEKLSILKAMKIDLVLCLRFKEKLASLSAIEFIELILKDQLSVKCLVVGDDFVFGCEKGGGVPLLLESQANFGFITEIIPSFKIGEVKVSATFIRQLLANGDFATVEKLLGRSYSITGRVAHGVKRGRVLGFPTANIFLRHKVLPLTGVYAVKIYGIKSNVYYGIANIGFRPTFFCDCPVLEVHLLDFNDDIYGSKIKVEFLHKIRSERKFIDSMQLIERIKEDIRVTRRFFIK